MKALLSAVVAAIALGIASTAGALTIYSAVLSGANEVPPAASPGSGLATVSLSDDLSTLTVHMVFSNLLSLDTAVFIHCCAPVGVNAGVSVNFGSAGFPLGVTSGTYDHTFVPLSASLLSGISLSDFVTGLNAGEAYINIHTSMFPGGEIRGQLAVPEPTALMLLGVGVAATAVSAWRRRAG